MTLITSKKFHEVCSQHKTQAQVRWLVSDLTYFCMSTLYVECVAMLKCVYIKPHSNHINFLCRFILSLGISAYKNICIGYMVNEIYLISNIGKQTPNRVTSQHKVP